MIPGLFVSNFKNEASMMVLETIPLKYYSWDIVY